jgi:hypothetical protein
LDWRELSGTARERALELLAAQTGSNYQKISTWTGTYSVHKEEYWSQSLMKATFESGGKPAQAVFNESEHSLRFATDVRSDSFFQDFETVHCRIVSADAARRPIHFANDHRPIDQRSVVTPREYIYYWYKLKMTTLGLVGTFPEAQGKRWGYRVPPEQARKEELIALMNPLSWFRCGTSSPFHQSLGFDLSALRGEKGPRLRAQMEAALRVEESRRGGGAWYRIRFRPPDQGVSTRAWISIWSQAAGFNPVSLRTTVETAAKVAIESLTDWRWTKIRGIFVPQYVKMATCDMTQGGINNNLRIAELKECALNEPIPASTFTTKALGLEEGELLADETNQTVYVVDSRGGTRKLAKFNEVYVPPEKKQAN